MIDHTTARALTAGRGSRNEATRRHNLSTLLALVHHRRGMTRAELTRATGLNRSTIGLLVADLVAAGLVTEEAAVTGVVGRPSPMVVPNPQVVALAINPDVDAVILGVVGLGGVVHARERIELDRVPTVEEFVDVVRANATRLMAKGPYLVTGAGVAVPGLVRVRAGAVARAPHLGWRDEDVAGPLASALGIDVYVDNDAKAGLVAETLFGAGRGRSTLVYLNGSASGIGGGVLADGVVLRGAEGFAGELGHTLVRVGGRACPCGRTGCLESEVNIQLLEQIAGPGVIDHEDIAGSLTAHPSPELAAEIDRQVDTLAHAIASFASVFNPELVVLGGFLAALHAVREERLDQALASLAFSPLGDSLAVVRAELGDELLVVGAGELAFAALIADPLAEDEDDDEE
ncbi:ROK family protein [Demequina sp.]|uniref:ROK family protein n=1 Tax=Demequina sp. TaxID=2050685 RepID=UPI003A84AE34